MDISQETFNQCINTNVYGTLLMTRAVVKHMAKRGSGKIVNVGSVVGYCSTPWAGMIGISLENENLFVLNELLGTYALSKAATHSMSDTLRLELKPFGIQVVVVAPGI
jgi:NAD(P)-dependent dehydrogenase (short-subunit alcohol dehydrogenase family)